MLERAKEWSRRGAYTNLEYARYADDLVILVDGHPRWAGFFKVVYRRLVEELAKLDVQLNAEKTRLVDLTQDGESFGFLGFDFRRAKTLTGKWASRCTPKQKARKRLLQKLKDVFRRYDSQPIRRVVDLVNPVLRGWVNYFRIGHSARCFRYVREWVEKKVRRHMMRAKNRKGFGWKRWSRAWLYENLGLFRDYRIRYHYGPKARPVR
jgi:RNA-directed DNA polymerase